MKNRRIIKIIIVLTLAVVVLGLASIISYASSGVANPIASGIGFFKVTFTDATYVEVQNDPKVIFFKPSYGMVKAMEEHGYIKVDQMGAFYEFEKDGVRYHGIFSSGRISVFRFE